MTTTFFSQDDPLVQEIRNNQPVIDQSLFGYYSDAEKVVHKFLRLWTNKDFKGAYDLLAKNSPLRGESLRNRWAARRRAWAEEAELEVTQAPFLYERGQKQKWMNWLDFIDPAKKTKSASEPAEDYKEVEAGWSIKFLETMHDDVLLELPQATAIYEQTGSHWFWVCYRLVQEKGKWRIHSMIDEGIAIQDLPTEELCDRLEDVDFYGNEIQEPYDDDYDPLYDEIQAYSDEGVYRSFNEIGRCLWYSLCYIDALIKRFPDEYALYQRAYDTSFHFYQYERGLAYATPLAQLQPTADNLRQVGRLHHSLSIFYKLEDDAQRAQRHKHWSEKAFYQKILLTGEKEEAAAAHIELAEQLLLADLEAIDIDDVDDEIEFEDLDEAKDHFLQARNFPTSREDEAAIETGLGEIAFREKDFVSAQEHFQRATELDPTTSTLWQDLGITFVLLGHFTEAEASFREAIERDPTDIFSYYCLRRLYLDHKKPAKALAVLYQALQACPNSARLHFSLATYHLREGNFPSAERSLRKAEQINPKVEYIRKMRSMFDDIQYHLDAAEALEKRCIAQARLDAADPFSQCYADLCQPEATERKKKRRAKRRKK